MSLSLPKPALLSARSWRFLSRPVQVVLAVLLGLAAASLYAQMEGERGVPPIASGGDFEVRGVKVDVLAKDAQTAREQGWRLAQRQAWRMLWT
ncbi:MAG: heavy-metal-associated domain-containing protein, partial [Sphingobium sp.]